MRGDGYRIMYGGGEDIPGVGQLAGLTLFFPPETHPQTASMWECSSVVVWSKGRWVGWCVEVGMASKWPAK